MENRYFIYYNNGYFETMPQINLTLTHMIETGVIKIIYDFESKKAWIRDEEGIAREVECTNVSGL